MHGNLRGRHARLRIRRSADPVGVSEEEER